jgi:hypothetical protein
MVVVARSATTSRSPGLGGRRTSAALLARVLRWGVTRCDRHTGTCRRLWDRDVNWYGQQRTEHPVDRGAAAGVQPGLGVARVFEPPLASPSGPNCTSWFKLMQFETGDFSQLLLNQKIMS